MSHQPDSEALLTYLEIIVLFHLHDELLLHPASDFWPLLSIEPAIVLDSPDDPSPLALLLENVPQPTVVCEAPECELEDKKVLCGLPGKCEVGQDLHSQQTHGQQVQRRLG